MGRPASGGAAVLERTISSGATLSRTGVCGAPRRRPSSVSRLRRPTSPKSWRTVVSGGVKYAASGMSSNPTTLQSRGTSRPASWKARRTPSAIWSLATNTAVTPLAPASSRPARSRTRGSSRRPAAAARRRRPRRARPASRRCAPAPRASRAGPATCQTVAVAELQQVARGGRRARELVDGHDRHRVVGPGLGADDGHVAGQIAQRVRGGLLRRDDDRAVHALLPQPLEAPSTDSRSTVAQAHDADEVVRVVGRALDPEQRRGRAVERRVERDDAERPRPAGDQRTRDRVRPILERAHRVEHALARLRAHVRAVVEDARDGLMRHAGELRDVRHDRRPASGDPDAFAVCRIHHPLSLPPARRRFRRMCAFTSTGEARDVSVHMTARQTLFSARFELRCERAGVPTGGDRSRHRAATSARSARAEQRPVQPLVAERAARVEPLDAARRSRQALVAAARSSSALGEEDLAPVRARPERRERGLDVDEHALDRVRVAASR